MNSWSACPLQPGKNASPEAYLHRLMQPGDVLMASTLATSSFVSRVFQQRLRANRVLSTQRVSTSLTASRAITRAKLGLCAMSSSATDFDKSTPEDKWREVLGTEEVHAVDLELMS